MTSPLPAVEIVGPNEVVVTGDADGVRLLRDALDRLVAGTAPGELSHEHLKTNDWGGSELTAQTFLGGSVVRHVKVYCDRVHAQ